jgi:hypothetical protein
VRRLRQDGTSKPFIEPFEMRESVPEFLTTIVISKKESATLSPVLQDEGSHYFLLVQWEILGHVRIISQYLGRKRPTGSYSPVADGLPTNRPQSARSRLKALQSCDT